MELQEYMRLYIDPEKKTIDMAISLIWGNVLTQLNLYEANAIQNCEEMYDYKWSKYTNHELYQALVGSEFSYEQKQDYISNYNKINQAKREWTEMVKELQINQNKNPSMQEGYFIQFKYI